ncbi:DUF2191 domain-containing protein [Blastococcus sp. KM273128]|uniref:ribbon-helix-helix domain-containing protein n=1 Tax=Blastococcus sp. KM273128 TaxID=2570314 RepID=UPI001F359E96|nr:CopG family transcriptional regulator [Blastococcus sp. KM273128]MCF6745998.1 DUF2191 domain-containing protein [Blastococcus sp. KM273128]
MRTTLDLDDDVLRRAEEVAARSGRILISIIEDALREALSRNEQTAVEPHRLRPFNGSGLQAGIDLGDSASLFRSMDQR